MTTPVEYKTGKKLNEKGFNEFTDNLWRFDGSVADKIPNRNSEKFGYSAPTIAEAVTWLYEKYAIWIFVASKTSDGKNIFIPHGRTVPDTIKNALIVDLIPYTAKDTPTEAYESAIEYCLTNLI